VEESKGVFHGVSKFLFSEESPFHSGGLLTPASPQSKIGKGIYNFSKRRKQ
jgi:hypothetical protein